MSAPLISSPRLELRRPGEGAGCRGATAQAGDIEWLQVDVLKVTSPRRTNLQGGDVRAFERTVQREQVSVQRSLEGVLARAPWYRRRYPKRASAGLANGRTACIPGHRRRAERYRRW